MELLPLREKIYCSVSQVSVLTPVTCLDNHSGLKQHVAWGWASCPPKESEKQTVNTSSLKRWRLMFTAVFSFGVCCCYLYLSRHSLLWWHDAHRKGFWTWMSWTSFKAIVINIFATAKYHKQCEYTVVACSDEPTENNYLNLQLPSASWSFIVSFSSLFSYLAARSLVWFTLIDFIMVFSATAGSWCHWKNSKKAQYTTCYTQKSKQPLLSTSWWT